MADCAVGSNFVTNAEDAVKLMRLVRRSHTRFKQRCGREHCTAFHVFLISSFTHFVCVRVGRQVRQGTNAWWMLHQGRLTTGIGAAALGVYEGMCVCALAWPLSFSLSLSVCVFMCGFHIVGCVVPACFFSTVAMPALTLGNDMDMLLVHSEDCDAAWCAKVVEVARKSTRGVGATARESCGRQHCSQR